MYTEKEQFVNKKDELEGQIADLKAKLEDMKMENAQLVTKDASSQERIAHLEQIIENIFNKKE